MNQLRDAAAQDAAVTTTFPGGFSKDDKTIVEPHEATLIQRWGVWASADGYLGGNRNAGSGTIGFDYRVRNHWLIGAYGSLWYSRQGFAQGGIYTAFYAKQFWGVLGGQLGVNNYTVFASSGYDFHAGNWLFGPVVSVQFDSVPVDQGFGSGNLFQTRAGGRVAYSAGRFRPEIQVMYQNQTINNDPHRGSALWGSIGVGYLLTNQLSLFGSYSFEGNSNYAISQAECGIRYQF